MPTGRQLLAGLVGAALSVSAAGSAGAATERFGFTGAPQSWRVPEGITSATFDLYGSAGEGLWGGYGARVRSTIPVTPGETLLIYVGGNHTAQPTTGDPTPANGGFNGGGDAGSPSSRSGGGATDVRRSAALADRLLIAGGGGGSGDEWNTADGSSAGGAGGQGGKTADNPGSGGGGGGATASAGGAAGAAGPGTGPTDNGCCWNPGLAGAPGTFGQGGAGAASQDGGGLPGGGGGGGLYGGGGGGSGGRFQNSEAPGEGGGGGGGSSLGAKPEDVTIEKSPTLYAQGTATVTYEDLVDMTVKLTRRPGRVLRRGDRVTVEAVIRVRKGRADKVVLRVESVRGFRLRRSNVGGPRCRLECEPDWVIGPSSPGHHAVYELTYRGGVSRPTFSVSVTEQDARDLTPSDNVAVMRGDKKWKRTPKR